MFKEVLATNSIKVLQKVGVVGVGIGERDGDDEHQFGANLYPSTAK